MLAKKQKLRDTTNLTPEEVASKISVAATAGESVCSSSSYVLVDDTLKIDSDAPFRSMEQHFVVIVHAVLDGLKHSYSLPVPWSVVAVSVA
jgi:hypothetical protein